MVPPLYALRMKIIVVFKQLLELVEYDVLLLSFFQIFAPTLFEEHWSCYVLEPKEKTLYVLDSMHDRLSASKKNLDDATVVLNIIFPWEKIILFLWNVFPYYSSGPTNPTVF